MSQTLTFVALTALIIVLLLLFLYFRAENREIAANGERIPIPGRFFIPILIGCTFLGMAITEWQGMCGLSPWGFISGIILGSAAEFAMYLRAKRKN